MNTTKILALVEAILAIVIIIVPLVWYYVTPKKTFVYPTWIEAVLGIIVLIIAALMLIIKPKPVK